MAATVHEENEPYDDINITPMLDLAYVLLIMFIILTTATVQGIMVNLPKASAAPTLAKPKTKAIESVRATLDAAQVRENQKLNRFMVLLTIAISGGPFLGLLGTVIGIMITFASIAATGDVNVNTIAPGVAAALFATVMGLVVAIPSLFGYNFIASRIAARVVAMEVFADQMVGRMHAAFAGQREEGPNHAP